MTCRKRIDGIETEESRYLGKQPGGNLPTAQVVPGLKVARARFRLSRGTWEPVVTMPRGRPKWKTHEDQSPDAWHRGGSTRSSVEAR